MSININNLISVCVQLAQEGCHIIKQSYMNKNIKKYLKQNNDPVTQADLKVQTMIIKGLKLFFPELKIIGQQTTQFQGDIDYNYKELSQQFLPKNLNIKRQEAIDNLCVWIDPIDCTKGFVGDYIQQVTVLIGITLNNKAQIGIIGIPYKKINNQVIYKPSVIFGSVNEKIALEYYFGQQKNQGQWIKIQIPKTQQQNKRIVVSNTRPYSLESKVIQQLKGNKLKSGGAGRKIVMVINGQVQMMIYMKSATQKWDTCAGQAVVKALGGYFLTPFGQQLLYNFNNKNQTNLNGFFCTFDKLLYKQTIKICTNMIK